MLLIETPGGLNYAHVTIHTGEDHMMFSAVACHDLHIQLFEETDHYYEVVIDATTEQGKDRITFYLLLC